MFDYQLGASHQPQPFEFPECDGVRRRHCL